jgi:hypothetical protein
VVAAHRRTLLPRPHAAAPSHAAAQPHTRAWLPPPPLPTMRPFRRHCYLRCCRRRNGCSSRCIMCVAALTSSLRMRGRWRRRVGGMPSHRCPAACSTSSCPQSSHLGCRHLCTGHGCHTTPAPRWSRRQPSPAPPLPRALTSGCRARSSSSGSCSRRGSAWLGWSSCRG